MFCELIGVGLCMRLETHLTHELGWFEHFNDPDTALSYLASLHFASCVVLYVLFLCFIMNVFVTRRSRSSGIVLPAARCVRPCQHVEASNNLSITLLPIRNVLILNRGN